jgi:hypothetical protein
MVIMNSTYTYAAHYVANVSMVNSVSASTSDGVSGIIELIKPITARAFGDNDIQASTLQALLCASNGDVVLVTAPEDPAVFPLADPVNAVYRPREACNWDLQIPAAFSLRATINTLWLAAPSELAITASRSQPLDKMGTSQKLVLGGALRVPMNGVSLQVRVMPLVLWNLLKTDVMGFIFSAPGRHSVRLACHKP